MKTCFTLKKSRIALCALVVAAAINVASCETFARAFADQMGRNAADAIWGKRASGATNTAPTQTVRIEAFE